MARPEESTRIVQLKVRLLGISPMIWRRVLVPASVSLRELHGILQVSMGWEGIHLYYFDIHAVHYGSFELSTESPDIPLSRFRFREGGRFAYLLRTLPRMNATLVGYARCSTDKQDLTAQRQALSELGVAPDRMYMDKGLTGTNRARPGLDQAMAAEQGHRLAKMQLGRLTKDPLEEGQQDQ